MAEDSDHPILLRKILVAVDTSAHSRAALEAAATLAKLTEANIHGIFVQEEHWSRVSRLPSTTVVDELTGESHTLEEDTLEQEIGRLKSRLHRQLKYISQRNEINHSWKTARGHVEKEILEAAREADLITIGRCGRSFLRQKKLGSTARAIIQKADKPTLILTKGLRLGNSVTAIYDATKGSQRGLKMALTLAEKNDSMLSVFVLDDNRQSPEERNKAIEQMVDEAAVPVRVSLLKQPNIGDFIHAVNRRRTGLLIIPKNHPFLQNDTLETALEYLNCPVLMMN